MIIKYFTASLYIFLAINTNSHCQNANYIDSTENHSKAKYLSGDLAKTLQMGTKYPIEALRNEIKGDVILSFTINSNGTLSDLTTLSSPHPILSASTIQAVNSLDENWLPNSENNLPTNKEYMIVFRFRMYLNTQPQDFVSMAEKPLEKGKFKKALALYDKAIKENAFDFEFFELRSIAKKNLGDLTGMKKDAERATTLKKEIMVVIDISAIGKTRTSRTISRH